MSDPALDAFLTKSGKKFVTFGALNRVLEPLLGDLIKALREQKAEIAALKASHAALDAKALKGGAPWQRGAMYAINDCVQHDGSLWKCVETHVSGATFSHEHFVLQITRGRDGRDAR